MIIPANKRVSNVASVAGFRSTNLYATAAGSGPAGSTTMTWVVVFQLRRAPATVVNQALFSRCEPTAGTEGWLTYIGTSFLLTTGAATGGGAFTPVVLTGALGAADVGRTFVVVTTLAGGTVSGSIGPVSGVVTAALAGYTPPSAARPTQIGGGAPANATPRDCYISECAFFNTFDGTGFVSTAWGNGLLGLVAMWQEDLQQGRYITCPRNGGVLGASDWYWSARDVVMGPVTKASWVDRSTNAVVMSRTGTPQGSGIVPRFA